MTTALERFGTFAAGLRTARLDDAVRHHARRAVVDWFAAALPGGVMPPATLAVRALADQVGQGRATLIPAGTSAGGQAAALINGTAAHTVEFDDIYRDGLYHPGAPTIAAALAAATSCRTGSRWRSIRATTTSGTPRRRSAASGRPGPAR